MAQISLDVKLQGSDTVKKLQDELKALRLEMEKMSGTTVKAGKEENSLAAYRKDQVREMKNYRFVMNEVKDTIGTATVALNLLALGSDGQNTTLKSLTKTVDVAFIAFQGMDAITGAFGKSIDKLGSKLGLAGGQLGLILSIGAAVAGIIASMSGKSEEATKAVKDLDDAIKKLNETSDVTKRIAAQQELNKLTVYYQSLIAQNNAATAPNRQPINPMMLGQGVSPVGVIAPVSQETNKVLQQNIILKQAILDAANLTLFTAEVEHSTKMQNLLVQTLEIQNATSAKSYKDRIKVHAEAINTIEDNERSGALVARSRKEYTEIEQLTALTVAKLTGSFNIKLNFKDFETDSMKIGQIINNVSTEIDNIRKKQPLGMPPILTDKSDLGQLEYLLTTLKERQFAYEEDKRKIKETSNANIAKNDATSKAQTIEAENSHYNKLRDIQLSSDLKILEYNQQIKNIRLKDKGKELDELHQLEVDKIKKTEQSALNNKGLVAEDRQVIKKTASSDLIAETARFEAEKLKLLVSSEEEVRKMNIETAAINNKTSADNVANLETNLARKNTIIKEASLNELDVVYATEYAKLTAEGATYAQLEALNKNYLAKKKVITEKADTDEILNSRDAAIRINQLKVNVMKDGIDKSKANLDLQKEAEIRNAEATISNTKQLEEAKALIEADYRKRKEQLDADATTKYLTVGLGALKTGLGIINDFQAQNSQANLDRIETDKEAALAGIDAKLQNEKLTAKQRKTLEAEQAAVTKKYDQEIRDEKTRAWESERQAKVIMAVIDTASAVVEALPNIPLSIIAGVLGAAQVALIASQPTPKFHTGGIVGQNPLAPDERLIVGQVGEGIISKQQMADFARNGGNGGSQARNFTINFNSPVTEAEMVTRAIRNMLYETGQSIDKVFVNNVSSMRIN